MNSDSTKDQRISGNIRAVILDVATLFTIENPWYWLKRYTKTKIHSFEMAYKLGSMESEYEALHREINLLRWSIGHESVDKVIEDAFNKLPFIFNAEDFLKWLSSSDLKIAVLGGAPRPIINRLAKILKNSLRFYDEIWVDRDSRGEIIAKPIKYGRLNVLKAANDFLSNEGLSWENIITIARDRFFKEVTRLSRVSIAFNPIDDEIVENVSYVVRGYASDLKRQLEKIMSI